MISSYLIPDYFILFSLFDLVILNRFFKEQTGFDDGLCYKFVLT